MATKIDSIPIEIQKLLEKAHSNCEFRKLFSVNVESIPRSQSLVPLSVLIPSLRQPNTCCVGVLSGMRVWPSGTDDFAIESIFVSLGLPAELPPDGTVIELSSEQPRAISSLIHSGLLYGWDATFIWTNPIVQLDITNDGTLTVFSDCKDIESYQVLQFQVDTLLKLPQ